MALAKGNAPSFSLIKNNALKGKGEVIECVVKNGSLEKDGFKKGKKLKFTPCKLLRREGFIYLVKIRPLKVFAIARIGTLDANSGKKIVLSVSDEAVKDIAFASADVEFIGELVGQRLKLVE